MLIKARNILDIETPKTRMTHTEASGVTVLRWQNPNAFVKSWAMQVGETGEEQTEVVLLNTGVPAGTAGTLITATLYEHPADTPLYPIKYNQVVFGSSVGTAVASVSIPDGTITYQADSKFTQFDDVNGGTERFYRTKFRNSVLSTETTPSDWITAAGFDFYSLGRIRDRVRDKLWAPDFIDNDTVVDDWINEWRDEMANEVINVNEDYSLGTAEVAFGTDGLGTVTTADFSQPRNIWMRYDATNRFRSIKMSANDFLPDQVFSSAHPFHNWRGDTIFQVHPADQGGTAEITFYRFGTTLVNDTDTLPQPMRPYTKSFVDYCVAQALYKDQKMDEGDRRMAEARDAKANFVLNLAPRDKTGPTMIDIVDSLSGEDDTYL